MAVIVAVAVAVAYKRGRMSESAVLSVLAAPVAWATYWLVALPAVIGLRSRWALLPVALIGLRPAWWTVPVGGLVVLALLLGVEVEVGDIADPVGVDERGESPRIGIGTEEEPEIVGGGSPPW